ncbi:hypothetical protein WV31_16325 [Magnetospirillum sp. ME-1]|uniref:c-type cytochrome n=1 Tax=Magnetospirillum sp. ME-1 TaxID=1639348 RepID=UPI000A17AE86|nr:cytochrome c [Magnetospirillum sp. ME-1]ARJ67120.1 hypothetical protein WV31_16325 [Magnetospirillum sp. ME-1]
MTSPPYEPSWPPHWPFAVRPSLAAWAEPRFQDEILAGAALAVTALVLCLAAWRWRWLILGVIPLAYLSASRLDLLLVPATPTSFHTSPTGFSARSVADGKAAYAAHCQSCHGIDGRGDGPEAHKQPVPPADLTADHLWDHPIGDLFWWVSRGMTGVDGRPAMPGFAGKLSEAERWAVIDFLHANAAGAELARTGRWPHDFMAPDMTARCADGGRVSLSQWRGKAVHIIVEGVDGLAEGADLPTLLIGGQPRASACAVEEAEARQALAVTLNLTPDDIAGSQFLVSPEGWLLGHWYQGGAPPPDTLAFVAETLRSICLSSPQANRFRGHH